MRKSQKERENLNQRRPDRLWYIFFHYSYKSIKYSSFSNNEETEAQNLNNPIVAFSEDQEVLA